MTSPIGNYLLESLLVLLALGGLAVLLLYGARRLGVGRSVGSVELLARLPLEPRRSVYVVRVLDRVWVLGASEAGLTQLGELPADAAGELRQGPMGQSFATALSLAVARGRAADAQRAGAASPPESAGSAPVKGEAP